MTVPADLPPVCPVEPDAADCCGEGCANCVFDNYEAALERYEEKLVAWRARQSRKDDDDAGLPRG